MHPVRLDERQSVAAHAIQSREAALPTVLTQTSKIRQTRAAAKVNISPYQPTQYPDL
jgi:hypothetical protein